MKGVHELTENYLNLQLPSALWSFIVSFSPLFSCLAYNLTVLIHKALKTPVCTAFSVPNNRLTQLATIAAQRMIFFYQLCWWYREFSLLTDMYFDHLAASYQWTHFF